MSKSTRFVKQRPVKFSVSVAAVLLMPSSFPSIAMCRPTPRPANMSLILPMPMVVSPALVSASSIVSLGGQREKSWRPEVRV